MHRARLRTQPQPSPEPTATLCQSSARGRSSARGSSTSSAVGRPGHQHVGRPRHQHVGRLRHPHVGCAHHQHVCRARLFAKRADYVRESAACLALVIWRRRDSTRAVPCTVVPQGTQMILSQGAESSTNPLCSLFTFSAGAQRTKRRGVCWGKGSNRTGLLATEGASSGTTPL